MQKLLMIQFYLILTGMYLYYARSKYFPHNLFRVDFPGHTWSGLLLTIAGAVLFIRSDGMAGGLLLALAACTLAIAIIQLFAVLGKTSFYGLVLIVHVLLLFELLYYAR